MRLSCGLVCLAACGFSGNKEDSLEVSVQEAHTLMSEGLFHEADEELLRAQGAVPEAAAELSLRRALLASRQGDVEGVGVHGQASNTPVGDLFAAEVLLVDLQTEEAKRLLHRTADHGVGEVQKTAEHYLQWLDGDDPKLAALAEVTALWALGDWATACEEAEEVVKGLHDEHLRRSESLLWASRAVAARQPDVAQGLLDDMDTPPEGQVWRFQAVQAMVWLADGRTDEARARFEQLGVDHSREIDDALVTACLTTQEPAIGEELLRDVDSPNKELCLVHHGLKDGDVVPMAALLSCATGWAGCGDGPDADLRLDWYQLYPRPSVSPFHEWPVVAKPHAAAIAVEPLAPTLARNAEGSPNIQIPQSPPSPRPLPDVPPEKANPEKPVVPEKPVAPQVVGKEVAGVLNDLCVDLFSMEGPALLGQLSDDQLSCLELRLRTAPTMTEKGKVSRLMIANAYVIDRSEWARLVHRHLDEIDTSDPDLCLKYALYLSRRGPSDAPAVISWAEQALERRSVWAGDNYKSRVNTLYKLRAAAGQSMWKAAAAEYAIAPSDAAKQRMEEHRNNTKVWAREWLEYAQATGKDTTSAASLCRSAAATSDYCSAG